MIQAERYHRDFYPVAMDGCVLYLPFWRYGANAQKIWDQSGKGNHGVITGAVPATYPRLSGLELVTNGGFEIGNPPTGWILQGTPTTFEQSAVQKHSGSYSTHILDSIANGSNGFRQNALPLGVGKRFKTSGWYYLASGTVRVGFHTYSQDFSTTGSWQYFENIQTATGASDAIYFVNPINGVAAEFYIDDVSIQEVKGYEGKGWGFDGVSNIVTVPDATSLNFGTGNFTILMWIRSGISIPCSYSPRILSKRSGSSGYDLFLSATDGSFNIAIGDGTHIPYGLITAQPQKDIWSQLGVVVNFGGLAIGYLNGAIGSTIDISSCTNSSSIGTNLFIANWPASNFFKGAIGETLIFNRALSAIEIKSYYDRSRGFYGV